MSKEFELKFYNLCQVTGENTSTTEMVHWKKKNLSGLNAYVLVLIIVTLTLDVIIPCELELWMKTKAVLWLVALVTWPVRACGRAFQRVSNFDKKIIK